MVMNARKISLRKEKVDILRRIWYSVTKLLRFERSSKQAQAERPTPLHAGLLRLGTEDRQFLSNDPKTTRHTDYLDCSFHR